MVARAQRRRARIGLVLSGGGARGAYEVGVLRYVRERLRCDTRFDVITGTSVGAVNGAYIAATCDRPKVQARLLARVWQELSIDRVYRIGWERLRDLPRVLFGRSMPTLPHGARVGGLVDTRHLEEIVRHRIPWPAISRNLRDRRLSAFACTATELATGISTTFVQSSQRVVRQWSRTPNEVVVPTSITADHALASAAIPALFPAVRVGDEVFVDGMLHQNTPLRPAMRLGADRLLVIGLRRAESKLITRQRMRDQARSIYPNVFFMLGKVFNAMALDKLEADLARIHRMNEMIAAGERAFGPEYADRLAEASGHQRAYRHVGSVLIRPSVNLGSIAHEVVKRTRLRQYDGLTARLIRRNLLREHVDGGDSDLASYVMFDPTFASELIDLGWEDAKAQHDHLRELFEREVDPEAAARADADRAAHGADAAGSGPTAPAP